MKQALFFVAGIAVGLFTSLVAAQGAGSIPVLNTSGAYIELMTLFPVRDPVSTPRFRPKSASSPRAKWFFRARLDAKSLQAGKAYWLPGLTPHDIRNESNRPAKIYVIAMKRCD